MEADQRNENPEILDAVLKETVDLKNIPIEEVFENLRCSRDGLTSRAAEERSAIFGHNKFEEKKMARECHLTGRTLWVLSLFSILVINSAERFQDRTARTAIDSCTNIPSWVATA